jgi:molybdate transport system substrate-binding protein
MTQVSTFILRLGILAGLCLAASPLHAEQPLRVSVAISLREATTAIAAAFETEQGGKVEFVFGSSGQLLAQIRGGAGVDVFISAANEQVDALVADKLVVDGSRRIVATNRLVLIVPPGHKGAPQRFEELAESAVSRVAIGEPATVPAGMYAKQVLEKLELFSKLESRLVFGTNVRQVLDYVERGEVSAGVVYATDARLSGEKVRVCATAEARWHSPVEYPAVVLRRSSQQDRAAAFVAYFETDAARRALEALGFAVPQRPADDDPPRAAAGATPPAKDAAP